MWAKSNRVTGQAGAFFCAIAKGSDERREILEASLSFLLFPNTFQDHTELVKISFQANSK